MILGQKRVQLCQLHPCHLGLLHLANRRLPADEHAAARFGGFPAPILHGLCTYGHTAQLLVGALCGGDPARFGALRGRFSAPVYPGDTLQVLGWQDRPGRLTIEARVQGGVAGDRTVFNNAFFEHR